MEEKPIYILHQAAGRALIPKIIAFLVLGLVFYLGVLLNISLLSLSEGEETIVKAASLILLVLIVLFGMYLAFHRAHLPIIFYNNRISFNKKELLYANITSINQKQNILDKMFHTHKIILNNNFYLKHQKNEVNIQQYLQQLISYAKSSGSQQYKY